MSGLKVFHRFFHNQLLNFVDNLSNQLNKKLW